MVNASLACLVIAVEVLKIIIEVDRSCAKITSEQGGVRSEHSGHIDVTLAAEGNRYSDLPLVEVRDYRGFLVARHVLRMGLE